MKLTKKQLQNIIKEELKAVLSEQISPEDAAWWEKEASMAAAEADPCGSPPGDDQGLWMWAECKCRGTGRNRKDPAYLKCMEDHGVSGLEEPHPHDEPTTYGGMHPDSGEKY
tara:strand:+ start:1435 stop:1770 length:336 start_codon:yes stop_codon:yes gene_type:complete